MTVIIGMDSHKRSATIEIIDHTGKIRAVGRYGTDKAGYAEMIAAGRQFGNRVWAVEGCNGVGRHIACRLVHDGETVVDVPAKLPPKCEYSLPATAARPTLSMPTRLRWQHCTPRTCFGSNPTPTYSC